MENIYFLPTTCNTMSISFSEHCAFETLTKYSYPNSKFFYDFETSWIHCKDLTERYNSDIKFIDMMINNLNCKVVNHIQNCQLNQHFQLLKLTMYTYFLIFYFEECDLQLYNLNCLSSYL